MKKQINQRRQSFLLATIAVIFLLGAFVPAFAQKGIGAKYGSRDPRTCADKSLPKSGALSPAQAAQYVICGDEHIVDGLYLDEEVTVQVAKGRPYNINEDFNVHDINAKVPVYPIRGSLKQYSCSEIAPDRSNLNRNCSINNEPNAKGLCYKDSFGDWNCKMVDVSTGEITHRQPPPGGAVAPAEKKVSQNNQPKTDVRKTENKDETAEEKDENGFPIPDFSGVSDFYAVIKVAYDYPRPYMLLTLKLKKEINPAYCNIRVSYLDEDGAEVGYPGGQPALCGYATAGQVVHTEVGAPLERDMEKVKKIRFYRVK